MPPVPLPLTFTEKGFAYQQIERQGDVAIYSQTHPGAPCAMRWCASAFSASTPGPRA